MNERLEGSGMARGDDRKREIMRILDDGREWSIASLTSELGAPSRGAILKTVINLQEDGLVEQLTGSRPTLYRKATGVASATTGVAGTGMGSTGGGGGGAAAAPGMITAEMIREEIARAGGKLPSPSAAPARPKRAAAVSYTGPKVITRKSGLPYYVRVLAGRADVEALRDLRKAGIPVMLSGPPGTGKTAMAEAAFPDLLTIAGDGDTTVADFIGTWTVQASGGYRWIDGPLVTAMKEGRPLLIDDATVIAPKVMAVLYPAMDGRREIIVKEHEGEIIKAEEGFYPIAAHNPGTHGAVLSDALSSRFSMQVEVHTDFDLAKTLKISANAIKVAQHLATRVQKGDIGWSPQLRELLAYKAIEAVLGEDAAIGNLIGIAPEEDREVVQEAVALFYDGRKAEQLRLGKQI